MGVGLRFEHPSAPGKAGEWIAAVVGGTDSIVAVPFLHGPSIDQRRTGESSERLTSHVQAVSRGHGRESDAGMRDSAFRHRPAVRQVRRPAATCAAGDSHLSRGGGRVDWAVDIERVFVYVYAMAALTACSCPRSGHGTTAAALLDPAAA